MYSPGMNLSDCCSPQSNISDQDQSIGQVASWSPGPLTDDSTFYSPPEDVVCAAGYPADAPTPPPSDDLSEELNLAMATMKAEAMGSRTPLIKEELRWKIQRKRRESGLGDLKVEIKQEGPEILTAADEVRRSRRRASNRRAATKCREKKKAAARNMSESFTSLEDENKDLKSQIESLEADRDRLQGIIQQHSLTCNLVVSGCGGTLAHNKEAALIEPQQLLQEQVEPQPEAAQSLLSQLQGGDNFSTTLMTDLDLFSFLQN